MSLCACLFGWLVGGWLVGWLVGWSWLQLVLGCLVVVWLRGCLFVFGELLAGWVGRLLVCGSFSLFGV